MTKAFKAVVFEKDKMERQDKSILEEILEIMAYQQSKSDVEKHIQDICKKVVRSE